MAFVPAPVLAVTPSYPQTATVPIIVIMPIVSAILTNQFSPAPAIGGTSDDGSVSYAG